MSDLAGETSDLVDYRRRVADLYHSVRDAGAGRDAWERWVRGRDGLFAEHPQSPVPAAKRPDFGGLSYFPYDATYRTLARLEPAEPDTFEIAHSADGSTRATRCGVLRFSLGGRAQELSAYWLEQYGGGLFVPFRDATCGQETYGGGRYLLDTAKGADLGTDGTGRLILDLNFAYHPSCYHDPVWSCPLAPPENRLSVPVRAGERIGSPGVTHAGD